MKHKFYGWKIHLGSRPYKAALEWQKRMVRYRTDGSIRDTLFYLEHPDVITLGRDYPEEDIACVEQSALKAKIEFYRITRGGGLTYHGPGQLVVYPVFNLSRREKDLHAYISQLEEGIIRTFADYGLECRRNEGYTGVWVEDRKIASIGVAVKKWITFHGAAINLTTNLDKFKLIKPCGLPAEVMTTAELELKKVISTSEFAEKLSEKYAEIFDTAFYDIDLEELAEIARLEESSQSM